MTFRGAQGFCVRTSLDPASFGGARECALNALRRFSIIGNSSTTLSVFQVNAGECSGCTCCVRGIRLDSGQTRWGGVVVDRMLAHLWHELL